MLVLQSLPISILFTGAEAVVALGLMNLVRGRRGKQWSNLQAFGRFWVRF